MFNWLIHKNKVPFAEVIVNRMGVVNTIGVEASVYERGDVIRNWNTPVDDPDQWLPYWTHLINSQGWATDFDGRTSAVVHQWDRFGPLGQGYDYGGRQYKKKMFSGKEFLKTTNFTEHLFAKYDPKI